MWFLVENIRVLKEISNQYISHVMRNYFMVHLGGIAAIRIMMGKINPDQVGIYRHLLKRFTIFF